MKKIPFATILIYLFSFCFVFLPLRFLEGSAFAAADEERRSAEKNVIDLVNSARLKGARCGNRYYKATRPVEWNETIAQAAKKHSRDMASKENVGHTASDGSGPGERIARLGYRWIAYGENVGEGYRNPEEAVKEWLKSPGHCRNIMNPGFKEAGAAYVKGTKRTYWTLVLATPEFSSHISP